MVNTILVAHALVAIHVCLAGIQDWKKREVDNYLTWPLFLGGILTAIARILNLDLLPLIVIVFILVAWYSNWLGGADARIVIGLWGLWSAAGFLGLVSTGLWGFILILNKQKNEHIPALVAVTLGTAIMLAIEVLTSIFKIITYA
ncbi:MAG: hypothetical protein WCE68_00465 [Anaerolineales bacterium]